MQDVLDRVTPWIGAAVIILISPFYGVWRVYAFVMCRIQHDEHDYDYQRRMRPGMVGYPAYDVPMECKRCKTKRRD